MVRRYFKRRYYNKDKYSVEQSAGEISIPNEGSDANVIVVPAADLQGMRKVKHLTISMTGPYGTTSTSQNVYWALVYVPAGTQPNVLNTTGTNLYEPNQFVMNCGIIDTDAGPVRLYSPVSRNLNSGDSIVLVIKAPSSATYKYVVRFAVTLQ